MAASSRLLPITVEQYEHFEGYPGLKDELIYGKIVMSPQPKPLHQQTAENLHALLTKVVAQKGYVAKQNSNIRFSQAHSMPAPDVFVVPAEVWRAACESDCYVSTAPVIVAEILSGSNRRKRLAEKVQLYLEHGVLLVLEVRPRTRIVISHSQTTPPRILREDDVIFLPEPTGGTIPVSAIFFF